MFSESGKIGRWPNCSVREVNGALWPEWNWCRSSNRIRDWRLQNGFSQ